MTAISTLATFVVIALTAVFALRQLQELQRSQSFDGTERLLDKWNSPELAAASRYVLRELPARLRDPTYVRELRDEGISVDPARHPEILVLRYTERVGAYVHLRVLLGAAIYESLTVYLWHAWPQLREVAQLLREVEDNPYMFDKTEMLYEEALRQAERQFKKLRRVRPSTGEIFLFTGDDAPP